MVNERYSVELLYEYLNDPNILVVPLNANIPKITNVSTFTRQKNIINIPDDERHKHDIRSILNKVTDATLINLEDEIKHIHVTTETDLNIIVNEFFKKMCIDWRLVDTYYKLFQKIDARVTELDPNKKTGTLIKKIILRCKQEFDKPDDIETMVLMTMNGCDEKDPVCRDYLNNREIKIGLMHLIVCIYKTILLNNQAEYNKNVIYICLNQLISKFDNYSKLYLATSDTDEEEKTTNEIMSDWYGELVYNILLAGKDVLPLVVNMKKLIDKFKSMISISRVNYISTNCLTLLSEYY
jgi:hypothetical protein